MTSSPPPNLLDEALGGNGVLSTLTYGGFGGGRMVLVEDCVETSGAFVVHHLLKSALSPQSSDIVVFLSFGHPFTHYDRILRKMGCNLNLHRENKRLRFLDMLWEERIGDDRDQSKTIDDMVVELYGKVQRAVEVSVCPENSRHANVIIDDVSLMEIDAHGHGGSPSLVLDFLNYCSSLTAQFGCSLVALIHNDVYSTMDQPSRSLLLQLEYLADTVIKVEPLATGLATDVHGQITVSNKRLDERSGQKIHNFQFRIKDSSIEYFYPGSKT